MENRPLLPLADEKPVVRSDAARNRELLLETAERMIKQCGVESLTMDALAAAAGVGKGTVFRRFTSREGLMAALLDHTEAAAQAAVLFGPPPLGPGAEPWDRLVAFGRSRIDLALDHAELIRAAGVMATRSYSAFSFVAMHVRYLFGELG
ncbi:TetR/AcrR family transcriptional regulator, partial [Nocardioides sp.]|uniref:TetR/AcrR family transcriptional regulator n=1 Tax=Nocardioides sp. TaxID=35761 RepID=UPI0035677688